MGHLNLYNKNQIREKLLLVLIFLKIIRCESCEVIIGLEEWYYMLRNAVSAVLCVNIIKCVKMTDIRIGGAYGNRFFILHNGL